MRSIVSRRVLWITLKYSLALGLLAYVVYANWNPQSGRGLREVWQAHVIDRQPINVNALWLSLVLFSASLLLTLCRWQLLTRAQDLPITWSATFRIGLLGHFFNTFLPGSVGGDIIKAAAVAREQDRRATAVATVIMDRILGLWSLVLFVALTGGLCAAFGMFAGSAAGRAGAIVFAATGTVAASVMGWAVMGRVVRSGSARVTALLERLPRVGRVAVELWNVIEMYRNRQGRIALAIGLSLVSHALYVVAFYCSTLTLWDGLAENPLPTLAEHFLIVPIGCVIAAIPLFPGGAGINEAGLGGLFALFGSAASNGILASLVSRFAAWVIGLSGYLVSHAMQSKLKRVRPADQVPNGGASVEQVTADGAA
jgi:uncharacterized protein (TIRG00374 family)